MKTTIENLIQSFKNNLQKSDLKISSYDHNGITTISLCADKFFDRIAENGWMYGWLCEISINEKGVIVNITENMPDIEPTLVQVLGQKAVDAYRERSNVYWDMLKKVPTNNPEKYRAMQDEFKKILQAAQF